MLKLLSISIIVFSLTAVASAQAYIVDVKRESARSDKFTGGTIRRAALEPDNADIKITINVPAFQMTLWQGAKEVRSYPIGVGMIDFPIVLGPRDATSIEWNPVWIPPSSEWIEKSSAVKPGEIILPTDPRNPLGKVKIPLGYGYLLHQAKGPGDMGSLVSHGCVRVMQADLYDLAEKIVAARGLDVPAEKIAAAKRNKKTLIASLTPPVMVEITYDTIVVENERLNIYPDVYNRKLNTVENVRKELQSSNVDDSSLEDSQIKKMIAAATGKKKFVVGIAEIENGNALAGGRSVTVVSTTPAAPKRTRRGR